MKIYTFNEWLTKFKIKRNNKVMKDQILNILEKTYTNSVLRKRTVPLLMSNPGLGKTTIIKEFAESKGVKLNKITLSQRMPNEVVGMMMPSLGKLVVYDSQELSELNDGDILFFDEVFNGTLKQTLDAVLNLLEDRTLPSGKKLADIMIIAASNPQGLINITPQIKQRFIRYDLAFNAAEFQDYLKENYGMPFSISDNINKLIIREKFETEKWNYATPRSIEKAINQIGWELPSEYDAVLMPYLLEEIEAPVDISDINVKKGGKVAYLEILKLIVKKRDIVAKAAVEKAVKIKVKS